MFGRRFALQNPCIHLNRFSAGKERMFVISEDGPPQGEEPDPRSGTGARRETAGEPTKRPAIGRVPDPHLSVDEQGI